MTLRRMLALAVAAVALAVVPSGGVAADGCAGDAGRLYLFSRTGVFLPSNPAGYQTLGNPTLTSKVIGCDTGAGDTRIIYPGSNMISLRYADDLGIPKLAAKVQGLGIDTDLELKRVNINNTIQDLLFEPLYTYDSVYLPLDPTKTGELTITLWLPEGVVVVDKWHTFL